MLSCHDCLWRQRKRYLFLACQGPPGVSRSAAPLEGTMVLAVFRRSQVVGVVQGYKVHGKY